MKYLDKINSIEKPNMEIKEKIFTMATNKGYRCPFVPKESNCPVTETLDKSYDILVKELDEAEKAVTCAIYTSSATDELY